MRIRLDFVTNSSSSSFTIARKQGFTEQQKAALLEQVDKMLFGKKVLSKGCSMSDIESYMQKNYIAESRKQELWDITREYDLYSDSIDHENADWVLQEIFEGIWDAVDGSDNIVFLERDLGY